MTQEEKQLLFKDLSARLPYGTKFPYHMNGDSNHKECDCIATIDGVSDDVVEFTYEENGVTRDWSCPISEVKPYLRPLSRWYMTADEQEELEKNYVLSSLNFVVYKTHKHKEWYGGDDEECTFSDCLWLIDWLNVHHFDYRGLIEKGLALEATEDMYKQ